LFDLDDTHAPSSAKLIVRKAVGTRRSGLSYFAWCAKAFYNLAFNRYDAECRMWDDYVSRFLDTEEALEELREMFTLETIKGSFYPGVEDFCSLVEIAKKYYVTGNISVVADAYADFLGFDGVYPNAYRKAAIVEEYFVRDRPHFQYYGVMGDANYDAEMVAALRFHGKSVIAILSSNKPVEDLDVTVFDVNTSRDQSGLVKILME